MGLKNLVNSVAERLGYKILPVWRIENQALADTTQAILSRHGVTTVIDVGANGGQYRDFLRLEAGFKGTVHSFEPQPDLAAQMSQRAKVGDPLWHIHNCALGSKDGELNLNLTTRNDFAWCKGGDGNRYASF